MKKYIAIFSAIIILLTLTSCETYAQTYVYDDEILYEYSYNNHPVRYVNGIPYYYLFDNVWRWAILPQIYHREIIHHPHPLTYHRFIPRHYGRPLVNHQRKPNPPRTRSYRGNHRTYSRGRY